jgi:hypothetical protein
VCSEKTIDCSNSSKTDLLGDAYLSIPRLLTTIAINEIGVATGENHPETSVATVVNGRNSAYNVHVHLTMALSDRFVSSRATFNMCIDA